MLRLAGVCLIAVWLVLVATGHFLGGWVHLLPATVLLGLAVRLGYRLATLD